MLVAKDKGLAEVILYTMAASEPLESWEVQFWMHLARVSATCARIFSKRYLVELENQVASVLLNFVFLGQGVMCSRLSSNSVCT